MVYPGESDALLQAGFQETMWPPKGKRWQTVGARLAELDRSPATTLPATRVEDRVNLIIKVCLQESTTNSHEPVGRQPERPQVVAYALGVEAAREYFGELCGSESLKDPDYEELPPEPGAVPEDEWTDPAWWQSDLEEE